MNIGQEVKTEGGARLTRQVAVMDSGLTACAVPRKDGFLPQLPQIQSPRADSAALRMAEMFPA